MEDPGEHSTMDNIGNVLNIFRQNVYFKESLVDYKTGERFTLVAVIINIFLAVFKIFAGIFGKSHAMLADGIHSSADSFSTGLVYAAVKIAQKPKNKKYNYGYGKIESIVSAVIGILLIFIGGFLIYSSVNKVLDRKLLKPSYLALVAAIISIISKEILFRYGMVLGKKLNSDAIIANCWDFRSDVYSSIGALIGIIGAIIGNTYNIYFLKMFDSIAGVIVGLMILKISAIVIKRAFKGLMDHAPSDETIQIMQNIIKETNQIIEMKTIKARYCGSKMYVDICIKMKPTLTIEEAYRIEKLVEERIREKIATIGDITIDLEPNV